MRKYVTVLFVCLLQNVFGQTTYYISPTGNDTTGNGTAGNPWATLAKACSSVTTAGDTIYVNPGTYVETNAAYLAEGVSIKGAGLSSHIISHYKAEFSDNLNEASLILRSNSEGTNGNQSISNILLDGDNLTGTVGILVKARSGVKIHDITIKDFYINGICYMGSLTDFFTKPIKHAEGNELYNAIIDNCTDTAETYVGGGLIMICGQKDLTIHNCIFSDTSRGDGANGDLLLNNSFGIGFKYYNNISYKPSNGSHGWNFHLEIPWGVAGTQIYNNTFYGGDQAIDVGTFMGFDPTQGYDYSWKIYNNHFEDYSPTVPGSHGKCSVCIEGEEVKNVYVYSNTFKNVGMPLGITDGTSPGVATHDSNIVFHSNVAIGTGLFDDGYFMSLVEIQKDEANGSIKDLYIINNTIIPNSLVNSTAIAIFNHNGSTMDNVVIANNIFADGKNGTWLHADNAGGTLDSLIIRNNILYNNPNNNVPTFIGNSVTNYINSGNIYSDPEFISSTDLSLQATSPAIGAAYNYGYGTDIGAIPYGGSISATGFNYDVVVDGVLNGTVSNLRNHDIAAGFSFYVSGFSPNSTPLPSQNGLPVNGKITSRTGTIYQFQPWDQNNTLWLNSGDSGTLTLTSPGKFEKIKLALISANGNSTVTYKVNYSDNSSDNGTFVVNDWACISCTNFAINQLGRVDGTGALESAVWAIYEDSIITNASKTINSIDFSSSGGMLSIFGLTSGHVIPPPDGSISVTGFNYDVIVDSVLNGTVSNLRNHDIAAGFSFYVSGFSPDSTPLPGQNGLPVNGKITSRTGTIYQFQPWDQNNTLWLNSGDSGTLTLTSPGKFEKIKIALISANGSSTVTYKVNYNDNSSDNGTFVVNDWSCISCTNFAINQLGRVDGTGALESAVWAIYEDSITTNASKTINSIDFSSSGGMLSIFGLTSGHVIHPPDGSISVTGFNYDVVVDGVLNGTVSNLRNHDIAAGFSFYVSGFSPDSTPLPGQNGLPVNGKITSRTGTIYQFQPWDQNNALWLNSGDSGTLTLTSPGKFEKIKIALISANGSSTVTYKVNYSDNSSDNGTFAVNDWACISCTNFAINQLGRVDGTGALESAVWAIYEDSIIANASKTINSIDFISSGGMLSIFGLTSGHVINEQTAYRLINPGTDDKLNEGSILNEGSNLGSIEINPNPVSKKIYLKIRSATKDKGIVVITDLSGRQVYKENISISAGNNSYEINKAAGLPNGIYFVSVFSTAQRKTIKVIKSGSL